MPGIIKKFLLGASVVASVSAIATSPAMAGNFSLSGSDYLLYDVSGSNTVLNPSADLDKVLSGNSSAPGGNVELFASSEKLTNSAFLASNARTSVTGTVAGKTLTLSSLTATDWFGTSLNKTYGAATFATTWFNGFLTNAGMGGFVGNGLGTAAFNQFFGMGGFQRASDPNISYVTTSGTDLLIGLAGHYNVKEVYAPMLGQLGGLIRDGFQASEVVKASYNGVEELLYSFSATQSGLVNGSGVGADGRSHSGNYEVALRGVVTPPPPVESVPEPSTMLGLMAVGGLFAAKRKLQKA
ncbi:MAG: NF038130 family PEP-CTERM protein [Kastovskya adunca ATA6-11-RM4]|nr:NF038130 family PEP-CTERM protein [Kastovskya adunca ATA6-11-RM4]